MEWLFAFSVAILWSFCLIENLHREIAHTPRGPGPATVRRQTNKYSSTCARLLAPVILISLQQLMDLLPGRGEEECGGGAAAHLDSAVRLGANRSGS